MGRTKGTTKFTPEEAMERNRIRNRAYYKIRQGLPLNDEELSLMEDRHSRVNPPLTEEERARRKRQYNVNARNKKLAELGLPLIALDELKPYKPKHRLFVEERTLPIVEPVKYVMKVDVKRTTKKINKLVEVELEIIDLT